MCCYDWLSSNWSTKPWGSLNQGPIQPCPSLIYGGSNLKSQHLLTGWSTRGEYCRVIGKAPPSAHCISCLTAFYWNKHKIHPRFAPFNFPKDSMAYFDPYGCSWPALIVLGQRKRISPSLVTFVHHVFKHLQNLKWHLKRRGNVHNSKKCDRGSVFQSNSIVRWCDI